MNGLVWVIVALIAVAIVIGLLAFASMRRRRAPFEVRQVPGNYVAAYQDRMDELERKFVSHPRESVAEAKLLVDDMMTRMGYPVRMNEQERMQDLRYRHRQHIDRYKSGVGLKDGASTEQLRRALQGYLTMARDMLDEGGARSEDDSQSSRRLAG